MDFNLEIDRRNTNSTKYDAASLMHVPEGLLPLWVADMDFRVPDPVREALREKTEHGIFGYTFADKEYYAAVTSWFADHFDFMIDPGWIVCTPGVVYALCTTVRAFTEPGDAVMLNRPVYYPFSNAINDNGRKLVNVPLIYKEGTYALDFQEIEKRISEENVKLYLFCSPHNPVGRVWTRTELKKLAGICEKYGVILVSDEIHCDFVWRNRRHTTLHNVASGTDLRYVICTAPSKTFNLAGLQASNIIIPDRDLRRSFRNEMFSAGYMGLNTMGMTACRAAYQSGGPWLKELRKYIYDNIRFADEWLKENIPQIRLVRTEGTYLLWLDCTELGMTAPELDKFMMEKAGLWLDGGSMFGQEGAGFQRLNAACTRRTLEQALGQLKSAVQTLE